MSVSNLDSRDCGELETAHLQNLASVLERLESATYYFYTGYISAHLYSYIANQLLLLSVKSSTWARVFRHLLHAGSMAPLIIIRANLWQHG